jgi:Ca2+/H+ antiporter
MSKSLTPSQRTAITAKLLLAAGLVLASEALIRDSLVRTVMASTLFVFGGGLLVAARHSEPQ